MGNRSYLYLKNPDRDLYIFEANNSLPFFWLSLLDSQMLKNKLQDWEKFRHYEETHTEDETERYLDLNSTNLTISKQNLAANAARSRLFLQKHFPAAVALYDDFVRFITSKFAANDYLEMDIMQVSAFYDSLTNFYEAIDNDLRSIETDNPRNLTFLNVDDLIANGTGFEITGNKEFSTYPTYLEALKKRSAPAIKTEQKFSKKSLIVFIVLLLLCPVFSFIAYKMYKEDGPTLQTILTGILNIGFYCFCIWSVVAEMKAYKKANA